jgi:hypothetical protein
MMEALMPGVTVMQTDMSRGDVIIIIITRAPPRQ